MSCKFVLSCILLLLALKNIWIIEKNIILNYDQFIITHIVVQNKATLNNTFFAWLKPLLPVT